MDNLLWSSCTLACSSTQLPSQRCNGKDVDQGLFLGRGLRSCFLIPRGQVGAFKMDILWTLCSSDLEAGSPFPLPHLSLSLQHLLLVVLRW